MHTILSFTIVPIASGLSLSKYIAACVDIVEASGLEYELHSNGTNIEGDWEAVMQTIKKCQKQVHAIGAQRIFTTIQLSTRTDTNKMMKDKLRSVEKVRNQKSTRTEK